MSITVLTATYNRAELLYRLYISLCKQTCYDFEWVIVDDASTDRTSEIVDQIMSDDNKYKIKYLKQNVNGGKHRAINRVIQDIDTEYVFIVDSDDILKENAIELIERWTASIEGLPMYAGVAGLRASFSGEICGGEIKLKRTEEYIDATNFERMKFHLLDDKAEIYKVQELKNHPFPEFEGENFIGEAICWDAIAAEGKKIRWFNEVIYLCEYLEEGLTKSGANRRNGHIKNIQGFTEYVKQSIRVKPRTESIADFREFNKTCKDMEKSISERAKMIEYTIMEYLHIYLSMPLWYMLRKLKYMGYR